MLKKLVMFGVTRAVGPRSKTWLFSSGSLALYRFVKKQTGRREVIDLSRSRPGDTFVIEHLPITHKEQIKQFKNDDKRIKREAKSAKKQMKAQKKAERRAKRS